ncbi:MAG: aminotransferase class I/II-fold pyridoxal phosphate-dependent enzyme, partial [Zetaproteobacteria bacterium]
ERAELVFLACPNNPTGNLWPEAAVRRIVDNYMGLVVIDEAYWPYAVRDHLHLVSDHVVVVRTFSKLGWAGLRIGYLIGDAALVQELNKVRLPYNVGRLNQAAALVFLEHWDVFMEIAAKVRAERARLSAMLAEIPGAEVFPSETNFVLVRVPDAVRADAALKQRGIWVKNLHGTHPELHHCLRITVGLPEENDEVVEALASVFREAA